MSKKESNNKHIPGYNHVNTVAGIEEYVLKSNKLRVLFLNRPNTGVVTTNITYLVGSRDENRGETGLAHMLEHMLFKPTRFDIRKGITAGAAVQFEQNTGCVLNANTWKDRTTYFFSYPSEFFKKAIKIEAERMEGVILTEKEFKPEQGNVLSEFDMYNGDPNFALDVQVCNTAFHSHPYGHETIGFREDIENYNAEKLERFYRNYYRPDNAIMMVVGDIDRKIALNEIRQTFGEIKNPQTQIPRFSIQEPKQESLRRAFVERPSTTNLLSIGFKHKPFPTNNWFITSIMLNVLTSGPESILHKLLIDTGKVSDISASLEPTSEINMASISITLAPKQTHEEIEHLVLSAIEKLNAKTIDSLVKKAKAKILTNELFERQNSLQIVRELTEYVSAKNWQVYAKTPDILKSITTKNVIDCMKESFIKNNLTIGYFIGKK